MAPSDHERRRSETTTLYQIVQQHLETYLALAGEADWDGQHVRADVERECRRYLECGILACGFCRARCPACGQDFLVAFSCKGRAVCPSCNALRMAETAARLVDHVFLPARPPVGALGAQAAALALEWGSVSPLLLLGRVSWRRGAVTSAPITGTQN